LSNAVDYESNGRSAAVVRLRGGIMTAPSGMAVSWRLHARAVLRDVKKMNSHPTNRGGQPWSRISEQRFSRHKIVGFSSLNRGFRSERPHRGQEGGQRSVADAERLPGALRARHGPRESMTTVR
jgi:hypothetical protein